MLLGSITFHEPPKMNYDTMTGLEVEVASQVNRAAQVTHSELTIPEILTKVFHNSKCVM